MQSNIVHRGAATRPVQQHSSPTTLWSVLTMEPERKDVGDGIVRHMVAPLSSQMRLEAGQFSFSRSLESDHPAVLLHVRATDDVAQRLWNFAHVLAAESVASLGTVKISKSQGIVYPPRPGEPVPELVEAIFARFGGPKGLELTGEISEVSSDLALWAVDRFPGLTMRSMLAALLLFDAGHAMMRGPRSAVWPDRRTTSWDYYWNAHLHACTGSFGSQSERARRAMMDRIAPRIMPTHRVMAALASEPAVDIWRKRWARAIDEYLYRADKHRISRSAQQLAMGASQLALNRLGFSFREQAVLGLYARAWSKDIEAQYSGEESSRTRTSQAGKK
ncbi:lantibiotic dehydratase C-terminal domain-containing protein [Arthrobacter sp. zg-Y1219]|uniref:lantibiotic dehydratase C-terminal domain-containing protein n=1 Tax=Arthrobacter sp. zg-Y1219 TaxID=3049067 RepID=UPI0024C2A619|nr:lantibiotic dehydratase C-terminal domain-containing protein [Arthrobacter sp. zg-Y1219]MDK1361944.1 lantibiotic dehydratase C-terminal domain-containing protein [Arthrobacter sp. zg-Y1219]